MDKACIHLIIFVEHTTSRKVNSATTKFTALFNDMCRDSYFVLFRGQDMSILLMNEHLMPVRTLSVRPCPDWPTDAEACGPGRDTVKMMELA
jgi:hypothetical protein